MWIAEFSDCRMPVHAHTKHELLDEICVFKTRKNTLDLGEYIVDACGSDPHIRIYKVNPDKTG